MHLFFEIKLFSIDVTSHTPPPPPHVLVPTDTLTLLLCVSHPHTFCTRTHVFHTASFPTPHTGCHMAVNIVTELHIIEWHAVTDSVYTHTHTHTHTHTILWPLADASSLNIQSVPEGICHALGECSIGHYYTDMTKNMYIWSWMVTEMTVREVLKIERCYILMDYQTCIKTKRNS
jgi:hypothetical protein